MNFSHPQLISLSQLTAPLLSPDKATSVNRLASNERQAKTKRITSLSKKRSYSAINLKNTALSDLSDHQLINESFRKSIASLMSTTKNENKSPGNQAGKANDGQQPPVRLKRNKSLIELKREKWDRERDELKDSESWYEKFDSLKKKPFDRSKSQPDIHLSANAFEDHLLFNRSVSRMFSPVSHFDDESIALSASYTALQSPEKLQSPPSAAANQPTVEALENEMQRRFNGQIAAGQPANAFDRPAMNRSTAEHSLNRSTSRSPNEPFNQLVNQPRRSFRRYAHQYNNVNILEKRRKQQEYQAQLEAQLAHKRQQAKLRSQQQMLEDRRFEEKLISEQRQLRKEFEIEHKEELVNGNGITWMLKKPKEEPAKAGQRRERKPTSELERLETKSKELIKLFKEASTQTDGERSDEDLRDRPDGRHAVKLHSSGVQTSEHLKFTESMNKWQTAETSASIAHNILQPVRSNRSALLRNSLPSRPPKWTKQKGEFFLVETFNLKGLVITV